MGMPVELVKTIDLTFDKSIFSKSAISRAGYHLAETLDIALSEGATAWLVTIRSIRNTNEDPAVLFRRTALDFELREKLDARTRHIRDRLVETALAEALPR